MSASSINTRTNITHSVNAALAAESRSTMPVLTENALLSARSASEREAAAMQLARELVFHSTQAPCERRPIDDWVADFRAVGYFSASTDVAVLLADEPRQLGFLSFVDGRPAGPIRLFRVCTPGRERRPHWAESLYSALDYAPGGRSPVQNQPGAHLYTAIVDPDRILARINQEWVTDTTDLQIVDLGSVTHLYRQQRVGEIEDPLIRAQLAALLGEDALVDTTPPCASWWIDGDASLVRGHDLTAYKESA